jgi:hypothetical protein
MPRTYAAKPDYAVRFWTRRGLQPEYVDLPELVKRKARHYFAEAPEPVPFHVICGDSRTFNLADAGLKFSRVVTSPPYLGMRTYVPDQWLRFWFLGGPETVTYRHTDQLTHTSAADFARQLGRALRRPAYLPLPAFALRLLFGIMAEEMFLDGQRVLPKAAEASGYRFRYPELPAALAAIVR